MTMQEKTDQPKVSNQDAAGNFRASNGEVVRRVDLDRAAGTPGRFIHEDPAIAGYDGIALAKAALKGDQAALDSFHRLAGLVLPDVTEHAEGHVVRIVMQRVDQTGELRAVFRATNQAGHDSTSIDAAELVAWILSPAGRAALAHRGVILPETTDESPRHR